MHKLLSGLIVVLVVCSCSGCAYMINNWPSWLNLTPPQTNQYEAVRREYYYRRQSRLAHNRRRTRTKSTSTAEEHVPSRPEAEPRREASTPAVSSPPPAKMTLAGDNADRDRARRLLESADSKLIRVNSSKLRGSDKAAYDRASELAVRARHALNERDYAAASSLAAKASSLANGLVASGF